MRSKSSYLYGTIVFLVILSLAVPQHASAQLILGPPTNLSAHAVSSSLISLSWSPPSNLGGLLITGYEIQRSTNGGSTWSTIVSNTGSASTSYSNAGLSPATTYTYRVFAITLILTSSASNSASATTDPNVPGAPSGLNANAVSPSQINLSWTAPSNNGGAAISGYEIEQSINGGSFSILIQNTGSPSTSYSDIGLSASTTYTYQVYAINSAGASPPSNVASATTPAPITVPSFPRGLSAVPGNAQVSLSWAAPTTNGGAAITSYDVYRGTISGGESPAPIATVSPSTLSYTDVGLTNGQTYYYTVKATNSVGSSASSNEASATPVAPVTPPSPPVGLSATSGNTQVSLSWTAPASNGGAAITGYNVYRGTTSGGEGQTPIAAGVTGTTYTDTGLANGQIYYYDITATNSAGSSQISNEASATPVSPVTPPGPPTGLSAAAASSSQVNLSWTAPASNGGAPISGYQIQSSTNGGAFAVLVQNTGTATTTYSDTGLSASTLYAYEVSAINSAGTGSASNTASVSTQPLTISLSKSGLVASDLLNNETRTQQQLQASQGYWHYGGSAAAENAPYDFYRDAQGLHVGVKAPSNGTYAGYYAVTPNSTALLFHSVITTPVSTVPSNPSEYYENGMYVQTFEPGPVNYVTCFSLTSNAATYWAVSSELGNVTQGTQYTPLYVNASANQPLTRDCTIITNGTNYLKVYLDGIQVYENKSLNLEMSEPFNAYLEPESSYAGALLNGTFTSFYITSGENIQVKNLPADANTVSITDMSGNVLSSATVSGGSALLDVGKYDYPMRGIIKAYGSSNGVIASTPSPVNIFGGDVYRVG